MELERFEFDHKLEMPFRCQFDAATGAKEEFDFEISLQSVDLLPDATAQAALLRVSPSGLVEGLGKPGEGNVMVRYLELVGSAKFVLPYAQRGDDPAYAKFRPKNFVDELVLKKWRKLGLLPSEEATDAEYLRRIYLDLIGALPTPQEVREFLADSSPDKRDAVVDRLLQRPEYVDMWTAKWGDILRNKEQQISFHDQSVNFNGWIRQAIAANKPWDQVARELLTVEGHIKDKPQIDWYRRTSDR